MKLGMLLMRIEVVFAVQQIHSWRFRLQVIVATHDQWQVLANDLVFVNALKPKVLSFGRLIRSHS